MAKPILRRRWMYDLGAAAIVFTFGVLSLLNAQAQEKKPNILIIWGDDIGYHNISAYNRGIMGYRTPNTTVSPGRGCCSPMPTVSSPARLAAPPSCLASIRSALGC